MPNSCFYIAVSVLLINCYIPLSSFVMLWYNVPLIIFSHFTCYLISIMRSIISSFQLVLNLFSTCISHVSFLFSLRYYNVASYKILLGPFIMYHVCKSWLHQRFFYFSLLPMLQLEVSKWLHKRNVSGINLTMLQWLIMYVSFYYLYSTVAESSNLAT